MTTSKADRPGSYRRECIPIDFDGTLTPDTDSPWRYDPEVLDVGLIRECQARGYAVCISTCANVDQVAGALEARGIRCSVDHSCQRWSWHDGQTVLVTGHKVHALVMLDDHGMTWRYGDDVTRVWRELERRAGCAWCPGPQRHHWGPLGAAGLLPWTIKRNELHLALAERSAHVHGSRCCSTIGGAIEPGETPLQAAMREAAEEVSGLDKCTVTGEPYIALCESDGCTWRYTTYAFEVRPGGRLSVNKAHGWETLSVGWYPADKLPAELHPGLAAALPELLAGIRR